MCASKIASADPSSLCKARGKDLTQVPVAGLVCPWACLPQSALPNPLCWPSLAGLIWSRMWHGKTDAHSCAGLPNSKGSANVLYGAFAMLLDWYTGLVLAQLPGRIMLCVNYSHLHPVWGNEELSAQIAMSP